jgi:hypothetical protein
MGIEPTLAAWEAAVLPLNYTRGVRELYSVRRPSRNDAQCLGFMRNFPVKSRLPIGRPFQRKMSYAVEA